MNTATTTFRLLPVLPVLAALGLILATPAAATQPDPQFTLLPSTTLWDGRSVMTVTTTISNWEELRAAGATNFTCQWTVDGVAATTLVEPGMLVLTRAQGSGPMVVTLVMDNGGAHITNSTVITVKEPLKAKAAWVVRTPDANEKPTNGQFYARDNTGYGTVYYNGSIAGSPSSIFITIYTNGGAGDLVYTNISKAGGGTYAFTAKIKAALVQYKLQFRSVVGGTTNLLDTVTDIVCGDAYLIDGQSNAATSDVPADSSSNKWIRSYGRFGIGWGYACRSSGANYEYNYYPLQIGYWEFDIASNLMETYKIPICMINGAVGGTRIDVHLPGVVNDISHTAIFNVLSNRVALAKLTHGIRGVFWHQGENNSGSDGPDADADYKYYRQYFVDLSAAWQAYMPNIQNYFIYQVWPHPCSMGPYDDQLREVQRNLPRIFSNMRIMSTVGNVPGVTCHTTVEGYAMFARVMLPLVEQDIYGMVTNETFTAPDLVQAYYTSTNRTQIGLEFGQRMAPVTV